MTITEHPDTTPSAGWFPDPEDPTQWRYWDGSRWTDQRSRRQATPAHGTTRPSWLTPKLIAIVAAAALAVGAIAWAANGSGSSPSPGPGPGPNVPTQGGGDAAVKSGVDAIARACSQFAGAYGYGPSTDDVAPYGAVAEFVGSWPTNPYTGEPMSQSGAPGDFSFNTAIRMPNNQYVGYVTGHLGNGQTYSVEFKY